MIKPKLNETRSEYLMRVAAEFIRENNLEAYEIEYDGAVCDGYCLATELQNESERLYDRAT